MHDARSVANYFLDRAVRCGVPVTAMTLLKVLYFGHAWHLVRFDAPLVGQPFEAWQYGPVNRVVYDQIKRFGSAAIKEKLKVFDPRLCQFVYACGKFDVVTVELMDSIFDYYSKFHAFVLSDLTHEKGSPWDVIWREAETKAVPGMYIPNSLIKEWFARSGSKMGMVHH